MVVRIRLARFGKRKSPFYNIVVAHARTARGSKPLEVLGTFDPIAKTPADTAERAFKDIKLDVSRAKYWIGVGAQPSDSAWKLLSMVGVLPTQFTKQKLQYLSQIGDAVLRRQQRTDNEVKKTQDIKALSDQEVIKRFTDENAPAS